MSGPKVGKAAGVLAALSVVAWAGCDRQPTATEPEAALELVVVAQDAAGSTADTRDAGQYGRKTKSDGYDCDDVEDCFEQCPEPRQDGGTTVCSCERRGGGFWCDVTEYGPGEYPEGGGGGGGCGGSGGGPGGEGIRPRSGGHTITKCSPGCGDARDGLAKEYDDDRIWGWGNWPCTRFSRSHSDLIGIGADGYHSHHEGYGLVSPALPAGIAKTEARFNISMVYTSGYRCPEKNATVSESDNPYRSHHIFGQAVDFYTATGWTAELKAAIHKWGSDKANAAESRNYPLSEGNHNHLAWR